MALTLPEIISLLPEAVSLVPKIDTCLEKFKASPRTAEHIMIFASDVLAVAAPLAGKIEAEVKD
jgi:hypothetical protein